MYPKKYLAVSFLLLGGCATSPLPTQSSKDAAKGQAADVATTAVGLSTGAAELNPLGWALLPAKVAMVAYGNKLPCKQRRLWHADGAAVGWGAAGWNASQLLLATAGVASAPVYVAVAGASGIFAGKAARKKALANTQCEPDPDDDECYSEEACWEKFNQRGLWPKELEELEDYRAWKMGFVSEYYD